LFAGEELDRLENRRESRFAHQAMDLGCRLQMRFGSSRYECRIEDLIEPIALRRIVFGNSIRTEILSWTAGKAVGP
jgi:hypothetical protein